MAQLKKPVDAIRDVKMFRLSGIVLGILLVGYFSVNLLNIPVSIIAGIVAIFFLFMARRSPAVNTKTVDKRRTMGDCVFLHWNVCRGVWITKRWINNMY